MLVAILISILSHLAVGREVGGTSECSTVEGHNSDEVSMLQRHTRVPSVRAVAAGEVPEGDSCPHVGARAWLSNKGMKEALQGFFPIEAEEANFAAKHMTPISGSGGGFRWTFDEPHISDISVGGTHFEFVSAEKSGYHAGVKVTFSQLSIQMALHYVIDSEQWWNPINANGNFLFAAGEDSMASFTVFVGIGDTFWPKVAIDDVEVKAVVSDILFTDPGVLTTIVNVLVGIFRPFLSEFITNFLNEGIRAAWNTDMNHILQQLSHSIGIPWLWMKASGDTSSVSEVEMSTKVCHITKTGELLVADLFTVAPGHERDYFPQVQDRVLVPDTPSQGMESAMISIALSEWSANNALSAYQRHAPLSLSIDNPKAPDISQPSNTNLHEVGEFKRLKLEALTAPQMKFVEGAATTRFDARFVFTLADADASDISVSFPLSVSFVAQERAVKFQSAGSATNFTTSKGIEAKLQGRGAGFWSSLALGIVNSVDTSLNYAGASETVLAGRAIDFVDRNITFQDSRVTVFADFKWRTDIIMDSLFD